MHKPEKNFLGKNFWGLKLVTGLMIQKLKSSMKLNSEAK